MSNDEETRLTREKRAGALLIGAAQLMEEAAANIEGRQSLARDLRSRAERTAGEGVRMMSDAEALLKELREARGWKVRAQRAEERAAAAEEKAARTDVLNHLLQDEKARAARLYNETVRMGRELDEARAELDRLSGTSTALADAIAAEQRAAAAEEKAAQMGERLAAIMAALRGTGGQ